MLMQDPRRGINAALATHSICKPHAHQTLCLLLQLLHHVATE